MFYLFGTEVSASDAHYLVAALASLEAPGASDAAEMISLGITGRRNTVPLSPAMQDAVYAALSDDPPDTLLELRTKVGRKSLLVKDEW